MVCDLCYVISSLLNQDPNVYYNCLHMNTDKQQSPEFFEATSTPPNASDKSAFTASSFFGDIIKVLFLALVIVLPIRIFIAQPFIVSGASMEPTFHNGDYLIIDELSYRFNKPQRGDVVIFRYPKDPNTFFIKRIIGLPNETITLTPTSTRIKNFEHPEGFALDESYAQNHDGANMSVTLGPDEYFVMGDNRDASSDSRSWGPLPADHITGRALLQLFPPDDISILPGTP